ncbi:hypothetical protein EV401DRAFT_2201418 [Pisolithus croceorrhizus]|nr:hypothetical protein EV401DRAFT_2201418 [Pisolithus croceorrhizus]
MFKILSDSFRIHRVFSCLQVHYFPFQIKHFTCIASEPELCRPTRSSFGEAALHINDEFGADMGHGKTGRKLYDKGKDWGLRVAAACAQGQMFGPNDEEDEGGDAVDMDIHGNEPSVGDSEGDRLKQRFLDSLAEITTRDKGGKRGCCVAFQGSGERHLDGNHKTSLLVAPLLKGWSLSLELGGEGGGGGLRGNSGAFGTGGSPDDIPHCIVERTSFCDDPDIRTYSADIHDANMRFPLGTSPPGTSRSQDLGLFAQLSIVLVENLQPRALPPKLPALVDVIQRLGHTLDITTVKKFISRKWSVQIKAEKRTSKQNTSEACPHSRRSSAYPLVITEDCVR